MEKIEIENMLEMKNQKIELFDDGTIDIQLYLKEMLEEEIPDIVYIDETMIKPENEVIHNLSIEIV